jgi:putative oxidoreductase
MTLWVLQVLLAVLFIYGGVNKLLGLQQEQEIATNFAKFGLGSWFRYFVAVLELVGGLGLLVPRLAGVAALWLIGIMTGAVIAHLTVLPPPMYAIGPLVLIVFFSFIAWGRWPQTRALLGR